VPYMEGERVGGGPAAGTPIVAERALGRRPRTFGHALIFCFVMM
jgi:hypothetical protein